MLFKSLLLLAVVNMTGLNSFSSSTLKQHLSKLSQDVENKTHQIDLETKNISLIPPLDCYDKSYYSLETTDEMVLCDESEKSESASLDAPNNQVEISKIDSSNDVNDLSLNEEGLILNEPVSVSINKADNSAMSNDVLDIGQPAPLPEDIKNMTKEVNDSESDAFPGYFLRKNSNCFFHVPYLYEMVDTWTKNKFEAVYECNNSEHCVSLSFYDDSNEYVMFMDDNTHDDYEEQVNSNFQGLDCHVKHLTAK